MSKQPQQRGGGGGGNRNDVQVDAQVLLRVDLSEIDADDPDSQLLHKTMVFSARMIVADVIESIVTKFGLTPSFSSSSSSSSAIASENSSDRHPRSQSTRSERVKSATPSSSSTSIDDSVIPQHPSSLHRSTTAQQGQLPQVRYGLYMLTDALEGKQRGAWLHAADSLEHYLPYCTHAASKKGMRSLHVSLRNCMMYVTVSDYCQELQKKVLLDVSATVQELIPVVVSRFALPHGYEYSLQFRVPGNNGEGQDSDDGDEGVLLGEPASSVSSRMRKRPSTLSWMDEQRNPSMQGADLCGAADNNQNNPAHLILRRKFWLNDSFLRTSNPYELHFAYLEVRKQIVDGIHPTTLEEAIEFASLHTQITYRNYDPLLHTSGFLRLSEILPPQFRDVGFIEEHIYKLHRQLKDVPEEKAKALYLRKSMRYATFGVSFVQCREHTTSGHSNAGIFIGVDSNSVVILHGDNKDAVSVYDLHNIDPQDFKVTLNKRDLWWRIGDIIRHFSFPSVEEISALVSMFHGYRARKKYNKLETRMDLNLPPATQSTARSHVYTL